jgi:hypothetical protein
MEGAIAWRIMDLIILKHVQKIYKNGIRISLKLLKDGPEYSSQVVQSEAISLKHIQFWIFLAIPGTYKRSYRKSMFLHKCSMVWRKEPFPRWNHQSTDSDKKHFRNFSCKYVYNIVLDNPKLRHFKKFVRLRSTKHLPKRRNQLSQHQLEFSCK